MNGAKIPLNINEGRKTPMGGEILSYLKMNGNFFFCKNIVEFAVQTFFRRLL
jgi:hypothetical protein